MSFGQFLISVLLLSSIGVNALYASGSGDSSVINQYGVGLLNRQPDDSSLTPSKRKVRISGLPYTSNYMNSYAGDFGTSSTPEDQVGKGLHDVNFTGMFRFVTIYRNMEKSYADMATADKNISFIDYPLAGLGTFGGVGNPILALAMTSRVGKSADFRVSYSISHIFTGNTNNTFNKFFLSNGGLAFDGNIRTEAVGLNLRFGGLLTLRVSRLIFDAPQYRNNYFDRLVSNQYSVSKTESVYSKDDEDKSFLWPYVKGGIARITLPRVNNLQFLFMYGRTGMTVVSAEAFDGFPAINYLGRVRSPFNYGPFSGGIALNYYAKDSDTDPIHGIRDDVNVMSTDFDVKWQRWFMLKGDIGFSKIDNYLIPNPTWGSAVILNMQLDKSKVPFPLTLQFYNIQHSFGNLDGEVLNSNVTLKAGGVTAPGDVNQTLFINVAQEVGISANNRIGIDLFADFQIKNLKIDIAYGVSQEKQNIYDTITFQHRVNGFSRSRFLQWKQGIGPYTRIRSVFARTFEMITITDEANGISTDYKKGFNNLEMLLKYKMNLFGRTLLIMNFNNFVSIQDHLSITPLFNDDAFIRSFYEDVTLMYKINNKFMVIGNFGYERVWGNERVNLSPDKTIDATGAAYADKDRTINQKGTAIGFGFGYDITTKMAINFRHKWMYHKDSNFWLDEFRGQESTVELKMFL